MKSQTSFLDLALQHKKLVTRRELFLTQMDLVITWLALVALIEAVHR
jgi:hypothetical protein